MVFPKNLLNIIEEDGGKLSLRCASWKSRRINCVAIVKRCGIFFSMVSPRVRKIFHINKRMFTVAQSERPTQMTLKTFAGVSSENVTLDVRNVYYEMPDFNPTHFAMVAAYRIEIYQVLRIEAVRKSVEKETNAVLKFYCLYVNYHPLALCEVMTAY
ncbi:uncharacterized protein [Bactrocera oleae]|uniref:uncharacterized protein n=1 Tax=Bactrocera oleae TaxID=104688 RepID=UPI00387E5258